MLRNLFVGGYCDLRYAGILRRSTRVRRNAPRKF
uniref:Uncharacterized protein n=1 Tax=Arundo donax TaxID=35708 RepID=A0A0A9AH43_ARUDO